MLKSNAPYFHNFDIYRNYESVREMVDKAIKSTYLVSGSLNASRICTDYRIILDTLGFYSHDFGVRSIWSDTYQKLLHFKDEDIYKVYMAALSQNLARVYNIRSGVSGLFTGGAGKGVNGAKKKKWEDKTGEPEEKTESSSEDWGCAYGRRGLNWVGLSKRADLSDINLIMRFHPEFTTIIKSKEAPEKLAPDMNKFKRCMEGNNGHDIYARLRTMAQDLVVYDIGYRYNGSLNIGSKKIEDASQAGRNDLLKLNGAVWSVAGNLSRWAGRCDELITQNPAITNADVARNKRNAGVKGIKYVMDTDNNTARLWEGVEMKGICKEAIDKRLAGKTGEDAGEKPDEKAPKEPKDNTGNVFYLDEGPIMSIKGDGWCFFYAAAQMMYGEQSIESIMKVMAWYRGPVMWAMEPNEDGEIEKVTHSGVGLANLFLHNKPRYEILISSLEGDNAERIFGDWELMWGLDSSVDGDALGARRPVQGVDLNLIMATKEPYGLRAAFISGDRNKFAESEWLVLRDLHFNVYPKGQKLITKSESFSTNIYGIHNDVHYYPDVLYHICEQSHRFPQYIIGWTFVNDYGRCKGDNLQICIDEDGVKMKAAGNDTCNVYHHPNFAMEHDDSVKEVSFKNGKYLVRAIRSVRVNHLASYRIMIVEPKLIDIPEVVMPDPESPLKYFKRYFSDNEITTNNGVIKIGRNVTYMYDNTGYALKYEVARDAPTSVVMYFFKHYLKTSNTQKSVNLLARQLDRNEGGDVDGDLNAVFIAQTLVSYFILEVADVQERSLYKDANQSLTKYMRKRGVGWGDLVKYANQRQDAIDEEQVTLSRNDGPLGFFSRLLQMSAVRNLPVYMLRMPILYWAYKGVVGGKWSKAWLCGAIVSGLASCCWRTARAMYNWAGSTRIYRSKTPKEFSSGCPAGRAVGGFMNKKSYEMLDLGFMSQYQKNVFVEKKKSIFTVKKYPFLWSYMEKGNARQLIRNLECHREPDRSVKTKGPNFGIYPIKYHTCPMSTYISLCRLLNPVPEPDPKILAQYSEWYKVEETKFLTKGGANYYSVPYKNWLMNVKPYVRNYVKMLDMNGSAEDPEKVTFTIGVKTDEFQLLSEDEVRPRPIQQARNLDKYNYRCVWAVCKIMADDDYAFRCGQTWEDDAKICKLVADAIDNPVIMPGDLSSNDATQSFDERSISDISLLKKIIKKMDTSWVDMESNTLPNVSGVSRQVASIMSHGDFIFRIMGKQNTGGNDTTFGNTKRNIYRLRFLLSGILGLKEVTVDRHNNIVLKGDFGIIVLGDDFWIIAGEKHQLLIKENLHKIFATERGQRQGLGHWLKSGFKVGYPEFCSRDCLFRKDGTIRWIRKIKRFIQTAPFTEAVKNNTQRMDIIHFEIKKLAYIEGIGILKWARGLPLYEKYANTLIRLGQEVDPETVRKKIFERWERRCVGEVEDIREEDRELTLELWEDAYNIDRHVILTLEKALDDCTSLHDQIISEDLMRAFKFTEEYGYYTHFNGLDDLYKGSQCINC